MRRTTSAGTTGCGPSSACASTTSTSRWQQPRRQLGQRQRLASRARRPRSCSGPGTRPSTSSTLGRGFHSNDARGTTIRVDPTDGVTPVDRVDPLVPATGAEIGLRSAALPGPAALRRAVGTRPRLGAAVRGRRRHHRAEPREPSLRRRTRRVLDAARLADRRSRLRVVARAVRGTDPAGDQIPGRGRECRLARRRGGPHRRLVRRRAAALLRRGAAHRGRQRAFRPDDAGELSRPATASTST